MFLGVGQALVEWGIVAGWWGCGGSGQIPKNLELGMLAADRVAGYARGGGCRWVRAADAEMLGQVAAADGAEG